MKRVVVWKQAIEPERTVSDMADVSTGAQAAIRRAMRDFQAFAGEPQMEALISKLSSIADPSGDVAKRERLADELVKVAKAELEAGDLSAGDRAQTANATRDAQMEYLRSVSPSAAAVLDRQSEYDNGRQAA